MPEIGYWKYVRFTDDEPQFWGTDDDIVQIFDSADDRLEYRMKKDIRYEDDAGVEILTIQKATRTLSGFKMTGDLEIEKDTPMLILDPAAGTNAWIRFFEAGVDRMRWGIRHDGVDDDKMILYDSVAGVSRFLIDRATGSITKVGDIDMGGNLMKNMKLGTSLNGNGYDLTNCGNISVRNIGSVNGGIEMNKTATTHGTGVTLDTNDFVNTSAIYDVIAIQDDDGNFNCYYRIFCHFVHPNMTVTVIESSTQNMTMSFSIDASGNLIATPSGVSGKLYNIWWTGKGLHL